MLPFNYHHLYYFYVIAEEGSITAAARKLRLAQSSLSMQLRQLETFLDRELFTREGKRLILTEEGNRILGYAKTIFDIGEELADSINDRVGGGSLRVQIGVSSFVPKTLIDVILNFLYRRFQNPYIKLVEKELESLIDELALHKLDMVLSDLAYQAPTEAGIHNHLIARIPVILCGHKKFARHIQRIPQDLHQVPMILPTAQSQTYHSLQEYFLSHKVEPKVVAEIQDLEVVRRLVLAGRGIAPINQMTIEKAPARGKLAVFGKPRQLDIHDNIYLIRKDRKSAHPMVTEIIEGFRG